MHRVRTLVAFGVAMALWLAGGRPAPAAPLPAEHAALAAGRLTDPDGRPVAGARVELIQYGRGTVAERETTVSGDFSFGLAGLGPEPALVRAWASGYSLGETAWFSPARGGRFDLVVLPVIRQIGGWVQDPRGRPVPGALVQWLAPGSGAMAAARADEDGQFTLKVTGRGPGAALRITAPGYRAQQLPEPTVRAPVRVVLAPARAQVSGQVLSSPGGEPLSGAQVLILSPDGTLVTGAVAGTRGDFHADLPQGSGQYRAWVWHTGHLPAAAPLDIRGSDRVLLPPVLLESTTATVSAWVLPAPGGTPAPGLTVHLDLMGLGTVARGKTGPDGRVAFPAVRSGFTYRVRAVGIRGQAPATSDWFTPRAGQTVIRELSLPTGSYSGLFGDENLGVGALAGLVTDDSGRPVSGAHVLARRIGDWQEFSAMTDESGQFRLERLPATWNSEVSMAGYWVTVEKEGWLSTDQVEGAPADGWVAVGAGQTAHIGAVLHPVRTSVAGTVVDPHGRPVPGAGVRLLNLAGGQVGTATSGPDGTFAFPDVDHLPYPAYVLLADLHGWHQVWSSDPAAFRAGPATRQVVQLRPGTGALNGRVRDRTGAPVSGGTITAIGSGRTHTAGIGADGAFRLTLPVQEGPFALTLIEPDGRTRPLLTPGGQLMTMVEPEPDRTTPLALVAPVQPVTLTGTVVNGKGGLLAGRRVVLMREGAGEVAQTRTDARGAYQFTIRDWTAGLRYSLQVLDAGPYPAGLERGSLLPVLFELDGTPTVWVDLAVPDSPDPGDSAPVRPPS